MRSEELFSQRSRSPTRCNPSDCQNQSSKKRLGDLALIKVKSGNTLPSVVLLSRTYPERVQAYWQGFLDAELERVKLKAKGNQND